MDLARRDGWLWLWSDRKCFWRFRSCFGCSAHVWAACGCIWIDSDVFPFNFVNVICIPVDVIYANTLSAAGKFPVQTWECFSCTFSHQQRQYRRPSMQRKTEMKSTLCQQSGFGGFGQQAAAPGFGAASTVPFGALAAPTFGAQPQQPSAFGGGGFGGFGKKPQLLHTPLMNCRCSRTVFFEQVSRHSRRRPRLGPQVGLLLEHQRSSKREALHLVSMPHHRLEPLRGPSRKYFPVSSCPVSVSAPCSLCK